MKKKELKKKLNRSRRDYESLFDDWCSLTVENANLREKVNRLESANALADADTYETECWLDATCKTLDEALDYLAVLLEMEKSLAPIKYFNAAEELINAKVA